ncbi:MAG TPA: hypothetical protein VHU21_23260 [Paraburkholderia sp.]|nr:hypothetical protein [Paraburkholderia sp.]
MPRRKPASFSVEFDRMLARARASGNARLVEHMERIRPRLNLSSDDGGEIHANAAHQFGDDFLEVARAIGSDPFDIILMLAGLCAHVLNDLQLVGLNYVATNHALTQHLDTLAANVVAHQQRRARDGNTATNSALDDG